MHQGQICMSIERVIVHKDIEEEFTERFKNNVETLNVGDPEDIGNVIGPIINNKQLDNIHGQVVNALDINDSSVNDEPNVPFGGMKNSGLGRHGGKASIDAFTELRWITLERGGEPWCPIRLRGTFLWAAIQAP